MINVIIGGSGYLGGYILKHLNGENNISTYRTTYESMGNEEWVKLDITNYASIDSFFEQLPSDKKFMFYYLAASHHPDKVEENWFTAWNVNVTSLSYFLSKLPKNSDLIYASTDNVYGESISFHSFNESDVLNPVNEYGNQKKIAESLVLSRKYKVARYSFLIGPSLTSKKHFYDHILECCKSDEGIGLICNSYRNAISFDKAAELTVSICNKFWKENINIINICSDEIVSKFDVGMKMVDSNKRHKITKIKMEDQNIFTAARAKNIIMDNSKLKKLLSLATIKLDFP